MNSFRSDSRSMRAACRACLASVAALAAGPAVATAAVTYVDANLTTGANDGSSWSNAFRGPLGLRAALDAGASTIWVADGTYYPGPAGSPASTTFLLQGTVKILGGFAGGEVDALSADPDLHVATLTGDLPGGLAGVPELESIVTFANGTWNTQLIGVTIDVSLRGPTQAGIGAPRRAVVVNGGKAVIERCVVRDGRAAKGGGILVTNAEVSIADSTIASNVGETAGGGIFADRTSELYLSDSLVSDNIGGLGAGVYVGAFGVESPGGSFPVFRRTRFEDNLGLLGAASGGGVHCQNIVGEFEDCSFVRCIVPGGGGGIFSEDSNIVVQRCRFVGCSAAGDGGGGIYCNNTLTIGWQTADIGNCLFTGNHNPLFARNGALVVAESCTFANSRPLPGLPLVFPTVVATGGQPSSISISNSILWGNQPLAGAPAGGNAVALGGSTVAFGRCAIEGWSGPLGGVTATATLSADPLLIDRVGIDGTPGTEDDDLRLSLDSPCIDAGDETLLAVEPALDLLLRARLADIAAVPDTGVGAYGFLDLGCFERSLADCQGDLTGEGTVDAADLGLLLGAWGSETSSADLDGDGVVGAADLSILLGAFGASCQ